MISNIVFFTLFILNKFKKYKLNLSKSFKNSRTEGGGYAYGLIPNKTHRKAELLVVVVPVEVTVIVEQGAPPCVI